MHVFRILYKQKFQQINFLKDFCQFRENIQRINEIKKYLGNGWINDWKKN